MDKYMVLKRHFGHSRFRQGQEQLIDAILSGHDVWASCRPAAESRYVIRFPH